MPASSSETCWRRWIRWIRVRYFVVKQLLSLPRCQNLLLSLWIRSARLFSHCFGKQTLITQFDGRMCWCFKKLFTWMFIQHWSNIEVLTQVFNPWSLYVFLPSWKLAQRGLSRVRRRISWCVLVGIFLRQAPPGPARWYIPWSKSDGIAQRFTVKTSHCQNVPSSKRPKVITSPVKTSLYGQNVPSQIVPILR